MLKTYLTIFFLVLLIPSSNLIPRYNFRNQNNYSLYNKSIGWKKLDVLVKLHTEWWQKNEKIKQAK